MAKNETEEYLRLSLIADKSVLNHLLLYALQLEEHHEDVLSRVDHEDDYQNGYIHGLTHALEYLRKQVKYTQSKITNTEELKRLVAEENA